MKNKIYGRSVGFQGSMVLLTESSGVSTGGKQVNPFVVSEVSIASAHRTVQVLRNKGVEGYIMFDGDPMHYGFTPDAGFVYPAEAFPLDELNPGWVKGWAVVRNAPWDLAGLFLTKEQADVESGRRGREYAVGFGSRKLGSNDFIFD